MPALGAGALGPCSQVGALLSTSCLLSSHNVSEDLRSYLKIRYSSCRVQVRHLHAVGSPILARCCDGELHQATARTREQTLEILLPQSMVSSHVLPGILHGPGCDVDPAGRTVAVSANTLVNIYSLDAFQQLAALRKHVTAVVAARYIDESQLLTASTDGQLAIWSTETWTLTESYVFEGTIHSLVVAAETPIAHVVVHPGSAAAGRIRFYDLAAHEQLKAAIKLSQPPTGTLAKSANGACVAVTDRRRALVWPAKQQQDSLVRPLVVKHTKNLTCVALSPKGDCLAVGDVSGRISIWNNCLAAVMAAADSQQQQQASPLSQPGTVHWHARAVCALTFSLDSLSLLSGGHEAVLVTWQLATNARSFIANMPERIDSIIPADSHGACYVVANANNTLSQVNVATGEQLPFAAGLLPAPARQGFKGGPVHRPGHYGQLILSSDLPSLQLFDYAHGRTQNVLQRRFKDLAADGQQTPSCLLSLSGDGLSLVTLEVQDADDSMLSSSDFAVLQTWQYVAEQAAFQPLAATHLPSVPGITSLVHHPLEAELAIGRSSGDLRLWTAAGLTWVPRVVLRTSGAAVDDVAFSADGSLLASATAEQLDIFDVLTGAWQFSLPCASLPGHTLPSQQVDFTVDGLLMVATSVGDGILQLTAWNLLTRQVAWSAQLPAQLVSVSKHSSLVVVARWKAAAHLQNDTDSRATGTADAVLQLDARNGRALAAWIAPGPALNAVVFKDLREPSDSAEAAKPLLAFNKAMAWQDLGGSHESRSTLFAPLKARKKAQPAAQTGEEKWQGQLRSDAGSSEAASHELGSHLDFARDSLLRLTVAM